MGRKRVTVIAAIRTPGLGTWIGSDQQVTHPGGDWFVRNKPKWLLGAGWAIGLCGTLHLMSMVEWTLREKPETAIADGFEAFMFCRHVFQAFGAKGAEPNAGHAPVWEFGGIFATPALVHQFTGSGAVVDFSGGQFCVTGSGCDYAQGAAHALSEWSSLRESPEDILRESICSAIKFDSACGGIPWVRFMAETA